MLFRLTVTRNKYTISLVDGKSKRKPESTANRIGFQFKPASRLNALCDNSILNDSPQQARRIMKCIHCGEDDVSKFGKDRKGQQRFRCLDCRKAFVAPHAFAGKKTDLKAGIQALAMLLEGMSVRAAGRLTGLDRDTILGIMVQAGESCRRFMEAKIVKVPAKVVECDEQWAFVFCKRKTAERLGKTEECGDRYVFTAIDRDTKLLLCWHPGVRSQDDTWMFADKLFKSVSGRPTINTDGFTSYTSAIPATFHQNCDYAQIVKHFQSGSGQSAQVRYSPGSITSVEKKVICGTVAEAEIGTSRMERFNLTTRMQVRRFTRLTNAHSKKNRNHDAMLGLYFAWYNWCRHHMTIKTTPAVQAGLATEKWTLERLLTEAAMTAAK